MAGELGADPVIEEAVAGVLHPPEEAGAEALEFGLTGRVGGAVMELGGIRGEVVELIFGDRVPDVFPAGVAHHALGEGTELIAGIGGEDVGAWLSGGVTAGKWEERLTGEGRWNGNAGSVAERSGKIHCVTDKAADLCAGR